jgi:predicted ATP-grasp superfamily ATP-dependent carboligase
MRRALAWDFSRVPGVRVRMTLDARLPDEPGPWELHRVGPGEEPAAFTRLAIEADYTLVIAPETEGILFDRARILDRIGARSLGSRPSAIAEAGNKLVTFHRFRASGVRTPPTRVVSSRVGWPRRITFPMAELAGCCPLIEVPESFADQPPGLLADAEIEHPGVLKPFDGAGSTHTFLLAGQSEWPDPDWAPKVALLQPWIDGELKSASVLVDIEGRPHLLGVAGQRVSVDRGRISYLGGIAPRAFDEGTLRMVSRVVRSLPGLLGWVGIDFVDDGTGEPIVLEVNPRPTTSVVAFLLLVGPGTLASSWLSMVEDSPPPLPQLLFDRVRDRYSCPFSFDPDGSIHPPNDGVRP